MPMANNTLWIAAGVTAATGAVAYLYWRRKSQLGSRSETKIMKVDGQQAMRSPSNRMKGLPIPGLKKIIRERKMVFVVNRPLLMNKQLLFVTVSTACLRYYQAVLKNPEYHDAHVKPWTRAGQMKVVLKANSGEELQTILERCRSENIEALLLNVGDLRPKDKNPEPASEKEKKGKTTTTESPFDKENPATPVVLCVLAPTERLDQITGHLKLL